MQEVLCSTTNGSGTSETVQLDVPGEPGGFGGFLTGSTWPRRPNVWVSFELQYVSIGMSMAYINKLRFISSYP